MSDKRATLEVIAPTVEEALTKGLNDLGLPREAVDIEILDEGSRGLFGLGARQARIRLTIKMASKAETLGQAAPQQPAATIQPGESTKPSPIPPVSQPEVVKPEEAAPQAPRFGPKPATVQYPSPAPQSAPMVEQEYGQADEDLTLRTARETVAELLEKMKVRAKVSARYGEPDDARSKTPVMVDIQGNDLSILIGRQAETLNALQYITNLIVSKELGKIMPVIIDVEGYRKRRENQLRQLARRMAEQAIKTGRRQILEPMPANERRIIHIELRDHPAVETESIGEEPRRKVTINLKK